MQCPLCHVSLPDEAKFCNRCGARLQVSLVCPKCGATGQAPQKFCIKCGTPLERRVIAVPAPGALASGAPVTPRPGAPPRPPAATPVALNQPDSKAPARRHTLLLAGGALVLVLVAVVAVVVTLVLPGLWQGKGGETDVARTTTAPGGTPVATPPASALAEQWNQAQAQAKAGAWEDVANITAGIRASDPAFQADRVRELRVSACTALARQSETAGAVDQAQAWWKSVLEEQPGNSEATQGVQSATTYLQAQAALDSKSYPDAIAAWKALYEQNATYANVGARLYEAYLAYGDALCGEGGKEAIEKGRAQYGLARAIDSGRPEVAARLSGCQVPTPTPTPSPTPLPGPVVAVITGTQNARVRSGPGLGYFVLGGLKGGDAVTVTGRTEDATWAQIQAGQNRAGWLSSSLFITTNYPLAGAAVVPTPAPLKALRVASAREDFSAQQGRRDWFYTISDSPGGTNFAQMPWNGGHWYNWPDDPRYSNQMRISEDGGHPSAAHDIARLWVSPYEGTLHISGRVYKESGDGRGGNGVRIRILQNKDVLWEYGLGSYDTSGTPFDLRANSKSGDEFYFVIGANGSDDKDNTVFAPVIDLEQPDGVEGTAPERWPEQYASAAPAAVAAAPAAARPAAPKVCLAPSLRHFEEKKGCCAEVAGLVTKADGKTPLGLNGLVVRIEGPGGGYVHEFGVDPGGGYNVTALSINPYTLWVKGPGVSSQKYELVYTDMSVVRAIVDFKQVPCQ